MKMKKMWPRDVAEVGREMLEFLLLKSISDFRELEVIEKAHCIYCFGALIQLVLRCISRPNTR